MFDHVTYLFWSLNSLFTIATVDRIMDDSEAEDRAPVFKFHTFLLVFIDRVESFVYLGSLIHCSGGSEVEIKGPFINYVTLGGGGRRSDQRDTL